MKRRYASRQPATKSARTASAAKSTSATAARATTAPAKSAPAGVPRFLKSSSAPAKKIDLTRQPVVVRSALQQPGQPLPTGTRREMERHLRHDLSQVRVHTGATAARSAAALQADAYTLGNQIAFAAGRYSPNSPEGRRLLAHELTHFVQQSRSGAPATAKTLETQADRVAASLDTAPSPHALGVAPAALQFKAVSENQTALPAPGDYLQMGKIGAIWIVFYQDRFKAVKKTSKDGKDLRQVGPNWVCNNPGNMTYDASKIGDKHNANIAVASKICQDFGVYTDPFMMDGRPFPIFPTPEAGRSALKEWFTALLTPEHPYWAEVDSKRKARTLQGATTEHAPAGDVDNDPERYARIIAKHVNASRAEQNESALRNLPFAGDSLKRGNISPTAITTVSPTGFAQGAQVLGAGDLDALVNGSQEAEGGIVPGFFWEVADNGTFPATLAAKFAKIPTVLSTWCATHNVTLP